MMIERLREEAVPVAIEGSLLGAGLLLLWVALVVAGSLALLALYAATNAPVFLTAYESVALVALVPVAVTAAVMLLRRRSERLAAS